MKVLLIEDSRSLQAGIRRALTKAGHDVTLSGDGQEGLDAARSAVPDLVILDMMLPTLAGTEVLKGLKSQPATSRVPVFVLTGLSKKNEQKMLHDGASMYFEKSDSLLDHNFGPLVDAVSSWRAKEVRA
jgi:DNA-binding response OmpR family regulator